METAEILAKLNDYDGDDLFGDVVWGLPGYDEAATAALDGGNQGDIYVIDGQIYSHRAGTGEWRHNGTASVVYGTVSGS